MGTGRGFSHSPAGTTALSGEKIGDALWRRWTEDSVSSPPFRANVARERQLGQSWQAQVAERKAEYEELLRQEAEEADVDYLAEWEEVGGQYGLTEEACLEANAAYLELAAQVEAGMRRVLSNVFT